MGDSFGYADDYYDMTASSCGEARTCDVVIGLFRCQDVARGFKVKSHCCADGRWHVVEGNHQYEPEKWHNYLEKDQLSPACDGVSWHSSRALHFDGASHLELPVAEASQSSAYPEIELWFRTNVSHGPLIADTTTPHRLYLSGGKLCFAPAADGATICTSESTFADGAWHHAAHTRYGLYADGTLRVDAYDFDSAGRVTAFTAGYGPVDDSTAPAYFVGDLDEIRIWREPRHQTKILDYYATRLVDASTQRRLFGYFPLEDTDSAAVTPDEARDYISDPSCFGEVPSAGDAGAAGAAERPGGTLVGFDFTTSPWIEPGAF